MDANYVVMIVVLIVWTGLFIYLFSLDRKIGSDRQDNES